MLSTTVKVVLNMLRPTAGAGARERVVGMLPIFSSADDDCVAGEALPGLGCTPLAAGQTPLGCQYLC